MACVRYWAVVVAADRYDAERLYRRDCIVLTGIAPADADRQGLEVGDRVVLVASVAPPVVFALGTVSAMGGDGDGAQHDPDDPESPSPETDEVSIAYDRRMFDSPANPPAGADAGPLVEIDAGAWAAIGGTPAGEVDSWLVSLDLPIEAPSAAEAVRQFWTYVAELGPRELPVFVSPAGDELAMQAMVAGVPVNLDPEEDG